MLVVLVVTCNCGRNQRTEKSKESKEIDPKGRRKFAEIG